VRQLTPSNTFKYDPLGRRIEKSSSATTSVFAYDGDNMIEETNSSGTVVARYSQTTDIDEPLAMLRSSATSYYSADGLGSVTSLTNSSGAAAETYTYDSFGKVTASTGSLVNPFQYTGRESDPETGLYYYRARYYDPQTGRFVKEDPIQFGSGDYNFYGYVGNDPNSFTDPTGRNKEGLAFRIPGTNYCGPNWTGGLWEEYDPNHDGKYQSPSGRVDIRLDQTCRHHDICYFNCRSANPCDPSGRSSCFKVCDQIFVAEAPIGEGRGWRGFVDDVAAAGIFWHGVVGPPAGPNKANCPNCKGSSSSGNR
jgi:RHS repeat-associated protein